MYYAQASLSGLKRVFNDSSVNVHAQESPLQYLGYLPLLAMRKHCDTGGFCTTLKCHIRVSVVYLKTIASTLKRHYHHHHHYYHVIRFYVPLLAYANAKTHITLF
jgi:hypothetical protein